MFQILSLTGKLRDKMENYKTAIILCGGKGSRLGSIGKKKPKTLIKVQKKEILWYIIKILKKNNFNHIILPLGYKGTKIRDFLKLNKNFDLKVNCINTGINSNIGLRIAKVINKIISNDVFLLNGDAIFNLNLLKIYNNHLKNNIDISFLSSEATYPYGTIGVKKKNNVIDFQRNLIYDSLNKRNKKKYLAYNYSGMCFVKKEHLYKFKNLYKNSSNFEQTFFPSVIKIAKKKRLIKINGFWHSIDNILNKRTNNDFEFKGYIEGNQ